MNHIKLSKRLRTVASFVRNGAVVSDVGTDHAYIPIYLIQNDIAQRVIATDINVGPINCALENIRKNGLEDKITAYVANGLDGIEEQKPTDILICGMGGELISEILSRSDYVKNPDISLILQPMTRISDLRAYLSNGFDVYHEEIVFEDGKYYQIICAKYDGIVREYTSLELELGKINIKNRTECFLSFLEYTLHRKEKVLKGLKLGECDTTEIESEIKEMERLR